jgi:aspartate racemase
MNSTISNKPFRIGIIGGMGPLAGVELQRLIIDATPAEKDQDHLQVITFTNPHIPDRTQSLAKDNGRTFVAEAIATAQTLESIGVDVIAMSCMTAHSRHKQIQAGLSAPLVNAVSLTCEYISRKYSGEAIGLLATNGSLESEVYQRTNSGIHWTIPNTNQQRTIMSVIYDQIKSGQVDDAVATLIPTLDAMKSTGTGAYVLGCTELGLLHSELTARGYNVIDPMRVLASDLVRRASKTRIINYALDTHIRIMYTQ